MEDTLPPHPVKPGMKFRLGSEQYSVEARLGNGGFGTVFRAVRVSPTPSLTMALKIPLPEVESSPTWRKKFEREARIMANLRHRHIAKVHQTVRFEGDRYAILQEYIADAVDLVCRLALRACSRPAFGAGFVTPQAR